MNLYKLSTEKQPLLFFETFLSAERLGAYERNFYETSINPSQVQNLSEGYIEYYKDFHIDDEPPQVRIYFVDKLYSFLVFHSNTTFRLLKERQLQKEFDEVFENGFVQRQLAKLQDLLERAKTLPHHNIILEVLDDLKKKITSLLYPEKRVKLSGKIKLPRTTTYPFFGNNQKTTPYRLKKLYYELLNIEMIDEEEVHQGTFIDVFTSTNPQKEPHKIYFKKDNYHVFYFLDELSPYFEKLKPAQIGRSESFVTKGNTIINEGMMNRYLTALKKKDITRYKEIKQAIINSMSPID